MVHWNDKLIPELQSFDHLKYINADLHSTASILKPKFGKLFQFSSCFAKLMEALSVRFDISDRLIQLYFFIKKVEF